MFFLRNFAVIKKYKVKITLHAQVDTENIWYYISEENPLNAIEFIKKLEEIISGLSHMPERNPVIPEGRLLQTSEYRHVIYKNYRMIYRIEESSVFVLRVFHGSKLFDIAAIEE